MPGERGIRGSSPNRYTTAAGIGGAPSALDLARRVGGVVAEGEHLVLRVELDDQVLAVEVPAERGAVAQVGPGELAVVHGVLVEIDSDRDAARQQQGQAKDDGGGVHAANERHGSALRWWR